MIQLRTAVRVAAVWQLPPTAAAHVESTQTHWHTDAATHGRTIPQPVLPDTARHTSTQTHTDTAAHTHTQTTTHSLAVLKLPARSTGAAQRRDITLQPAINIDDSKRSHTARTATPHCGSRVPATMPVRCNTTVTRKICGMHSRNNSAVRHQHCTQPPHAPNTTQHRRAARTHRAHRKNMPRYARGFRASLT